MADPTRVNLARFHATRLSLRTRSEVDIPSFNEMLSDYAIKESDDTSLAVFHTAYSRGNVPHSCLGIIVQLKPSVQEYEFRLTYSTSSPLILFPPPEGTRLVNEMLQTLADIRVEQSFSCRAHFEYPRERYLSKVVLPATSGPITDLPYTEITGMRFRKLEEGATLYDAIIDHGRPEDVVGHSIGFTYVAEFAPNLAVRILEAGRDISLKFGQVYE
ncbi:MAG: hypothetical protein CEE40_07610 [Chloroflexi bacterium B3_Chlor]|nr:MAG: hypothetical protein CEE40_07610 [Chloroflexi bacterium B3_Chlor]